MFLSTDHFILNTFPWPLRILLTLQVIRMKDVERSATLVCAALENWKVYIVIKRSVPVESFC